MDFILPPSPAGGIQWEKVLPPLIPRLNGTYGQHKWSPNLLLPETDNSNSAGVGHLKNFYKRTNLFLLLRVLNLVNCRLKFHYFDVTKSY